MDMKNVVVIALVLLVAVLVYYQYDPTFGGMRYMLEGFADEKDAKAAKEKADKEKADKEKADKEKAAKAEKEKAAKKDGFYNYEEEEQKEHEGYYDYSASNGKKVAGFAASPGAANEVFNNAVPPTNPVKPPSEGSKAAGFADMKAQPKKEGFADLSAYEGPAQFGSADAPAGCYPRDQLTPSELLPKDMNSVWAEQNPMGPGSLKGKNFLSAGALIGVNTVGQSLRNANLQLRSEPPNPQVAVSIFNQSTIASDTSHRPLEIGA
jgi:hypothetical protein